MGALTVFAPQSLTVGPMKIGVLSTNDLTVLQLLERERSLRIMASTALVSEEASVLLGLAEDYESLATQRQTMCETKRDR
jgi:hypothetical protein